VRNETMDERRREGPEDGDADSQTGLGCDAAEMRLDIKLTRRSGEISITRRDGGESGRAEGRCGQHADDLQLAGTEHWRAGEVSGGEVDCGAARRGGGR
jgi:hypothetical protein